MAAFCAPQEALQGALPPRVPRVKTIHFIRKFVKCNRNPLIPNLLHLHELVIGIASVRSRSPVSGLGGRAKRPACGRAKRPAWGVEPSVQLGVEPSVQLGSEPSVQLGGSSQASSLGSVVGHLFPDFVGIWAQVRSGCGLRSFFIKAFRSAGCGMIES